MLMNECYLVTQSCKHSENTQCGRILSIGTVSASSVSGTDVNSFFMSANDAGVSSGFSVSAMLEDDSNDMKMHSLGACLLFFVFFVLSLKFRIKRREIVWKRRQSLQTSSETLFRGALPL